jgi:ribonuclease P protein component
VGILPSQRAGTRVGLRTKRGLKGAVVRNRLKRQLRAIVYQGAFPLRLGLDVVIVIHPARLPISTSDLRTELLRLCQRAGALC